MIPDIRHALDGIASNATNLRHAGGAGKVFELFVMTGIACALQTRGYDVWLQRSDGSRIRPTDGDRRFIQRGGVPTGLPGAAQGSANASAIGFRWPGRDAWEILNGVQFIGRSTATHEIDIAIIPASVAATLRSRPMGGIPIGRPRVSIECKDVGTNGSVDEMRALVARLYDLTLLDSHHPYLRMTGPAQAMHPGSPTGLMHQPASTYWAENRRTLNIIARRTGFAGGAAAMTSYHAIEPHEGIVVASVNSANLMDSVADWIQSHHY